MGRHSRHSKKLAIARASRKSAVSNYMAILDNRIALLREMIDVRVALLQWESEGGFIPEVEDE